MFCIFNVSECFVFFRFFFNVTSSTCEEFLYGGCSGNENKFNDIGSCNEVCNIKAKVEQKPLKSAESTDFENTFGGWEVYSWKKFFYDSSEAEEKNIEEPTIDADKINEVGIMPEHHLFDFRQPSLTQEFQLEPDSLLIMEFLLLVRGVKSSGGIFSFFFKLDPGFDVYIGNIKVFNFKQHGINDEVFEFEILNL